MPQERRYGAGTGIGAPGARPTPHIEAVTPSFSSHYLLIACFRPRGRCGYVRKLLILRLLSFHFSIDIRKPIAYIGVMEATMSKWALVMHDGRDEMAGRVLSLHKSQEAAEAADAKLQRATRRVNGATSWCQTRICRPAKRVTPGYWLHRSEILGYAEPR